MSLVNWSNITDFGQLPAQANTATNGAFWPGMYFMIFVILVMVLISFGVEISLIASSFIMIVIGLLMAYAGILPWTYVVIMVCLLLFMFMYVGWSGSRRTG